MVITYDSRADVVYIFDPERASDVEDLKSAAQQQTVSMGEGLTIYKDLHGRVLGLRCEHASVQLNLATQPIGGMQLESKSEIRQTLAQLQQDLARLKAVLDPLFFAP